MGAELPDAKLWLKLMASSKQKVAGAKEKGSAAVLQITEVQGRLGKVTERCNAFHGRLREVEAESGCRLIRSNNVLAKQASMCKVFRGIIGKAVKVSDGFENRLGSELVNLF